jgi:hypothetical protein
MFGIKRPILNVRQINRRFQMQVALALRWRYIVLDAAVPSSQESGGTLWFRAAAVVLMFLIGTVPIARAQNAIAGHVGFVIPWVT